MTSFSDLAELFIKILSKSNKYEKKSRTYGTDDMLYAFEIHTIEMIGRNPEINGVQLAKKTGVTKGAISQVTKKLIKRGYIIKFNDPGNNKEFKFKLRNKGELAFEIHKKKYQNMNIELKKRYDLATENEIKFIFDIFSIMNEEIGKELINSENN